MARSTSAHEVDDFRDVLGDAGVHLRAAEVERAHLVDGLLDVVAGHVGLAVAVLADASDDLLVDVGEVLDVVDVIAR